MNLSRDLIYAFFAVALAGIGWSVLHFGVHANDRLRSLLRVIGKVLVSLGLFVGATLFLGYSSRPLEQMLQSQPFWVAAVLLIVSAYLWFRPLTMEKRRSRLVQWGYPVVLVLAVIGSQLAVQVHMKGLGDALNSAIRDTQGKLAPEIRFADSTGVVRGISEFKGNVVLVNFWATTCPPCVAEMPGLSQLQSQFKDRGFVLIYLSSEDREVQDQFFNGRHLDGIHGRLMPENPVPAFYASGTAWPICFLIGRNGVVKDSWLGSVPPEFAESKIAPELESGKNAK